MDTMYASMRDRFPFLNSRFSTTNFCLFYLDFSRFQERKSVGRLNYMKCFEIRIILLFISLYIYLQSQWPSKVYFSHDRIWIPYFINSTKHCSDEFFIRFIPTTYFCYLLSFQFDIHAILEYCCKWINSVVRSFVICSLVRTIYFIFIFHSETTERMK